MPASPKDFAVAFLVLAFVIGGTAIGIAKWLRAKWMREEKLARGWDVEAERQRKMRMGRE